MHLDIAMARLSTALVLLLAALAVVAPVEASGTAPWTVSTAANDFGADRPDYRYTLDPGGRLEDGLVVVNHGAAPLDLALYAADAFTTDAGRLGLAPENAKSSGVGAWVHPARDRVTVPPGQSREVPFTIELPGSAAPGDYVGGIVTSHAGGTDVGRRIDIPIRVRVGGALTPALAVESLHVRYSGTPNPVARGSATVAYKIHNTGNAIVTARQAVSVAGPFGRWVAGARTIADSPPLLPDDTWTVSVSVPGVAPAVRLTATVALVPLLTDAAGSTAPVAATTTSGHTWALPWTLLLAGLLVTALVAGALVLRRRGRGRGPA